MEEKESPRYSVIVPVYNRPGEVDELLESLAAQTFRDFEVIVVEDGSSTPCGPVVEKYESSLDISYHYKPNTGPGQSRNAGADRARGEYLIILDSDVTVPPGYFEAIEKELSRKPCDAFGGPDRAAADFTPIQKAISYSMTSFLTTGGIRGKSTSMDKFHPRSFNMGIRRSVFSALGGFCAMRFGEDIDLSIRIFKGGYSCRLFPDAWVYHKRRTSFGKFFKQVYNSGMARINLYKKYPDTLKLVHVFPAAFTVSCALLLIGAVFSGLSLSPIALYALLVFLDSSYKNRSAGASGAVEIGFLSVAAAFVQLIGYGCGFLRAWFVRCVLGRGDESLQAYKNNFYN